jgi:hypothetical protein
MSISNIYKSYLYNQYLVSKIQEGSSLDSIDIANYFENNIDILDLSVPQFDSDDYVVVPKEHASALKMNNTISIMKQDLTVLYKTFVQLMRVSGEDYERWINEISLLEKRLLDLEDRIDNLLLIAQDTEGYHSFFQDNLTDLFYIDLTNTTVAVDILSQAVFMIPTLTSNQVTTRIFLNDLKFFMFIDLIFIFASFNCYEVNKTF